MTLWTKHLVLVQIIVQCNLHLVVCVNQSYHSLRLVRKWKLPICAMLMLGGR